MTAIELLEAESSNYLKVLVFKPATHLGCLFRLVDQIKDPAVELVRARLEGDTVGKAD